MHLLICSDIFSGEDKKVNLSSLLYRAKNMACLFHVQGGYVWLIMQSFLLGEERLHDEPKEYL